MKQLKKLASLLLALTLVFAMATTAFAAETNGSITISNPVDGQTYKAYLMFELESYNPETGAYSYKITEAWREFVTTGAGKDCFSIDAQNYVTLKTGVTVADNSEAAATIAKAAVAYAASKNLPSAATLTKDGSYTATGLTLGYYVVDSSLGALCGLTTTEPAATIREKNEVPTNVKTVEEDSTGNYGEKNDADIGQTVNFKSTITAQAGAENYVFHDTMSDGLTYTGVTGITLNDTTVDAANYTVTAPATDGDTFDVTFTQAFCDTLKASDQIVISYTATLNEKAVIAGAGNPNTSKLSYGDKGDETHTPSGTTPPSTTTTYTWNFNVFKYTMDGEAEKALAGAKFTLSKNADGSNPIALVRLKDNEGNDTNTYRVAKTGETGTVNEITTDATGKFTIEGLDADTYYLTETQAPTGYNKLASAIKIIIDSEGNVKKDSETTALADKTVKVENKTGTELPSTGGMGTTIFYVLGGILAVTAIVLLVTKKRMNSAE